MSKGFTLIEMMVVVAILGIIAAIAYPSYQEHVRSSRRASAQSCLMEHVQFMERYRSRNMTYVGADLPNCAGVNSMEYDFELSDVKVNEYVITATPSGVQAADKCGNLSVNAAGEKSATLDSCWKS